MKDSDIISLYWSRNQEAISQSEKKYGSSCFAIAHNILGSIEDSQECVSDTWLHAWNAIPPQRPEKLGSFLMKITRNLSLNRFRDSRTQKHGRGERMLVLEELAECIAASDNVEAQSWGNVFAGLSVNCRSGKAISLSAGISLPIRLRISQSVTD